MSDKNYGVNIGYPVRDKSYVQPLINGEEAWGMVYDYLTKAKTTIHLCFWALEADMELIRNNNEVLTNPEKRKRNTLFYILNEKAREGIKVRILLWKYPLNAKENFADKLIRLSGMTGIFEVLYQPHPNSIIGSWHQKTIIIDDIIAFVGGMNAKENDWDTSDHSAFDLRRATFRLNAEERRKIDSIKCHDAINPPRHDYMALLKGALVTDVQSNFVERWNFCISEKYDYYKHAKILEIAKQNDDCYDTKSQVIRTIPSYPQKRQGEKGILEAYVNAIRIAEKYIYIENQYFRSQTLAEEVAKAYKKNNKLKIIIVTQPAYLAKLEPYDEDSFKIASPASYWTSKAFETIKAVCPNLVLYYLQSYSKVKMTIVDTKSVFIPIDLHSKIMIIDDEWYTIGSCNVNDRGFETEGELNISIQSSSAKEFRKKILSLHLKEACPDDIDEAFNLWFYHSRENYLAWRRYSKPKSFIFCYNQKGPILPMSLHTWF